MDETSSDSNFDFIQKFVRVLVVVAHPTQSFVFLGDRLVVVLVFVTTSLVKVGLDLRKALLFLFLVLLLIPSQVTFQQLDHQFK